MLIKIFTGVPILVVLLTVILFGIGEKVHSQLLQSGEKHWPGYHELRKPKAPDCDPNTVGQEEEAPPEEAAEEDDLDDLDDLFGEEEEGPSDEAIQKATRDGRKTVLARDIPFR